ncbi:MULTISPECIES: hypothetical protein [Pandoraea]|nr:MULTISPECIES: hypothetical protein [Pandoraea]MCI3207200.1 hypothetical protein [Pandoraea sp. LA3]MDN4585229.1 hypothetical protein [Pandoraea capi]
MEIGQVSYTASVRAEAAPSSADLVRTDNELNDRLLNVLLFGPSVAVVGEWPQAHGYTRWNLIHTMRDDFLRLRDQRGTFTIAANPTGDGIGREALRVARELGIGTLAVYESADPRPQTPCWDQEIVIASAEAGAPTQTPEGKRDVFGTMQALHPSSGALLSYGGGDAMTSVAEAWHGDHSVFVETKFMAPDKRDALVEQFLQYTHIQTMAHAHVNGYQGEHTSTDPKCFYDTAPDITSHFPQNDARWLGKIGDFLGDGARNKWRKMS